MALNFDNGRLSLPNLAGPRTTFWQLFYMAAVLGRAWKYGRRHCPDVLADDPGRKSRMSDQTDSDKV
jgi:hypothetical protein